MPSPVGLRASGLLWTSAVLSIAVSTPRALPGQSHPFGVYVQLVSGVRDRGFDDVIQSLRRGIEAAGWVILASYESGVDRSKCAFRAQVFVVHSPPYARAVVANGPVASFALPLRVAAYEDENGIHISATNPQSLNRTIVAETGFETESAEAVAAFKRMVAQEFPSHLTDRQHGQLRVKGQIDKTMGIIAGGPFTEKLETVVSVPAPAPGDLPAIADRVYQGLERLGGRRRWQIRPVYRLDLLESNLVIIGVTGAAMEAKAFNIVNHGDDDARKTLACPGIDHAAAFPIEIALTREGDQVKARIVDEMFRMKIYFEDAGRTKFAANMRMPGSIESEIRDLVEEALGI